MTARRPTDTPMMMTVTTGRTTLGFILRRGDNVFEAFDHAERSLGVFKDQRSAADAISGDQEITGASARRPADPPRAI